jgi:hypothetical protein
MLLCVAVFSGVQFSVGKVFFEVLVFRVLLKRGAITGLSCADPGVSVYESRYSCGTKSEIVETFPFLLLLVHSFLYLQPLLFFYIQWSL